jgi:pyruvate dehydrogenase E2 component (dihydrolipoamide acetyltransferase)
MSRDFRLPDLGEGLTEAEIVSVLVAEGEEIKEDQAVLVVETEKAQVELPSPFGGRVDRVHVRSGQRVKVGAVLLSFADAGGASRSASSSAAPAPAAPPPASAGRAPAAAVSPRAATPATGLPPAAAPATRRLARELGVDLRMVRGSGPAGRVTDDDVRAAADAARAPAPVSQAAAPAATRGARPTGRGAPAEAPRRADDQASTGTRPEGEERPAEAPKPLATVGMEVPPLPRFEQWGPVEREPLSHLRRTIAERMTLSATIIPHVTHFDRVDITDLDAIIRGNEARARADGVSLTLTSFLLKASALALRRHPRFNATLDAAAGELILKRYYHLGVAVAMDRGLIVPVIRDVDRKPLMELARELAALAQRVRDNRATLDDLRGGTFTVTNIGALGGTGAIPIINYPEVAILGVARARQEPVVRDGQIVPRLLLPITLTFDHRVADGADGARFAAEIVRLLEHPDQLLLEL